MPRHPRPKSKLSTKVEGKKRHGGDSPRRPWRQLVVLWALWAILILSGVLGWLWYDLPDLSAIAPGTRRPRVEFYDANNGLLLAYGDSNLPPVHVGALPPHIPNAILAIEDHRFYEHRGIDPVGMIRAFAKNVMAGHVVQGGSTLTQQLAKTLYFSSTRRFKRKVQELMVSVWLEATFTKDQILSIYMNRVYLGPGIYGFPAAAKYYFNKPLGKLTPLEAAGLAGMLKAPSTYSPKRSLEKFRSRTKRVIAAMATHNYINADQASSYQKQLETFTPPQPVSYGASSIRYFLDWIMSQLHRYLQATDQDLKIYTTLNAHSQRSLDATVSSFMHDHKKEPSYKDVQLAMVMLSPKGEVLAMVGGRDYLDSSFNRATQALRQTGSLFKIPVYLTALEGGSTLADTISDGPIKIGGWRPKNYGWRSRGEISLQDGLAYSVNTVTVRLAQKQGIHPILKTAHKIGMIPSLPPKADLTVALGSLESTLLAITSSMATLANGCHRATPYGVKKIVSFKGEVLYSHWTPPDPPVVSERACAAINKGLQAAVSYGTARRVKIENHLMAGKTGTTQNHKDAWVVAYDWPAYVIGVWVGKDDGKPLPNSITGGKLPAQLARKALTLVQGGSANTKSEN